MCTKLRLVNALVNAPHCYFFLSSYSIRNNRHPDLGFPLRYNEIPEMNEPSGVSDRPRILRCGPFEINMVEAELRRHGIRLKLQGKPFHLLAKLLERPATVVTREELREKLWAEDTYVDFERSLNVAMSKLRATLGEDPENPRYVETVRGRGYRFIAPVTEVDEKAVPGSVSARDIVAPPAKEAAAQTRGFPVRASIGVVVLGILAVAAYVLLRPVPPPKVLDYTQLTRDGHAKAGPVMTDGLSVYFLEPQGGHNMLTRVPALGGEPVPVRQLEAVLTIDLSPVRPEVLVVPGGATPTESHSPILLYPLPAGSPRRIGDLQAHSAIWSPDGEKILYANSNNIYVARSDGSEPRRLMNFPLNLFGLRWSPTGRTLPVRGVGYGVEPDFCLGILCGWKPRARPACRGKRELPDLGQLDTRRQVLFLCASARWQKRFVGDS